MKKWSWRFLSTSVLLSLMGCDGELVDFVPPSHGIANGGGGSTVVEDAGSVGTGGSGTPSMDAGPPLSGQQAFAVTCAPCHGVEGQGTALAPELQHPVADFATWVVRTGRDTDQYPQPMAARSEAEISDQQLEEIWSWLSAFEDPSSGQGLFEDFCANCHGANARGGRVGIPIYEEEADDIQKQVREGEDGAFAEIDSYMPARPASELSDAELALIAEYVAGL